MLQAMIQTIDIYVLPGLKELSTSLVLLFQNTILFIIDISAWFSARE